MLLKLENIGMIERAEVKLDGLTVIAGENDTGKSTVGKMLYLTIKLHDPYVSIKNIQTLSQGSIFYTDKIFDENSVFILDDEKYQFYFNKGKSNFNIKNTEKSLSLNYFKLVLFIDTPDILTKAKYIKNANLLMFQNSLKFFIPHQVSDLILRLSQDIITNKNNEFYKKISEIIHGEVYYDSDRDDFYFKKENLEKEVNIHNTSNGIKMFGLLQILIANETIKENSILILDEPEVHLHPKWQLKYAEIIVELVKSGVIVLVTTHSPYMLDALNLLSIKNKVNDKTNFYLAKSEDRVSSIIEDVTEIEKLQKVYEMLGEEFNNLSKLYDEVEYGE